MNTNETESAETTQKLTSNKGEKRTPKRRGLSKRASIGVVIAGVALIILCAVFLPRVFPTADSLIEQGKYEEAYEIADKNEKPKIAVGNIVAWCSAEAYRSVHDTFSGADSFELLDAYYDGTINFILHVSYRGVLGVKSDAYFYYKYMSDGNISLFTAFSDLNEEETYSESASESEKMETLIKNATISSARGIVEDPSFRVDDIFINEVNTLIENGEIFSVELIPQAKEVIEFNKNAQ